jgi:hypothetical protein
MAGRGRASFEKRRREMARKEKQRLKAERRAQRKIGGLPELPEDQGPEEQSPAAQGAAAPGGDQTTPTAANDAEPHQ